MPDDSNSPNTYVRAMAPDASTSPVDWSRPIEAVHEDGRVVPVTLGRRDETMDSSIFVNGYRQRVHFDGKEDWAADWGGLHLIRAWRIRNVQTTTPERDPALWDRMVGLVRRLADGAHNYVDAVERARAIVAALPKSVDPDLILAREMAKEMAIRSDHRWGKEPFLSEYDSGALDDNEKSGVSLALHAIKRGRELAGEQA